ncbi:Transposable element Tc1 transposase [Araneus ventricosus]|uniref:Transposable element Tc1 transposase n=1 Tax=Araneus ventricosus TaxID=182803 RepID=A0A4Y2N4X0_ARAVE|nr:Transposable element Tc1 transposase [Araneus ventricosus]
MGKAADLSEFDRGQIVMARRLGTSTIETARLVGCSRYAAVSIHAKWINDGDTRSRRQGVGRPRVIKEKGRRRLSDWVRHLPGEQFLPSCTAGHTQAGGGGIILWGTLSWAALGPVVVVEQTMKAVKYLNIIADQLHPYMAFVFPTRNGIFQQDNAPCHKARIVLEWFEEHTDEFHLMSWPPNSPDLNPMEHILGCHGAAAQSANTTMSEYLDFSWTLLRHLVQPFSSHVPKTFGIYAQANSICFEGQRRRNALLSRWS